MELRKCAQCGKEIRKGYVWDRIDTFCSKKCAAKAIDSDRGCVDILINDGRIVWQEKFPDIDSIPD